MECTETTEDGQQYFAWLTTLPVNRKTVAAIAEKGGRYRWKIENEGFNRQKNSGLNLEHVYSTDPEKWKVYYLLLQIAFILVQLLERGSLLRRLAAEVGRPVWKLFGSLKNVSRRLLESLRFLEWEETWFDRAQAAKVRIGFDSSSLLPPLPSLRVPTILLFVHSTRGPAERSECAPSRATATASAAHSRPG